MLAGPRLALLLAGLAAAVFVGWPGFSIDRNGSWRTVLAGFQLQRETGDFIGATSALIHFHGLDGRPGRVRFVLTARVEGEQAEIDVVGPTGVRHVTLGAGAIEVDAPLDGSRDLELKLLATASTNPRPIRLSNLRVERDFTPGSLALSFIPFLLGALVFTALSRESTLRGASAAAVLVIAASAFFLVAACDPVRALSLATKLSGILAVGLALGFAVVGLLGERSPSAAIALVGATLSLHLHTLHSGFVYDDRLWARPWTLLELGSTFVGSEDPSRISGDQYRPVPSLTHALDYALWGPSPFAFHAVNMGLHALSAFLLFALLERLRVPRRPAFLGALTLAVHPLAASSIGWISERTDTLTDIFILATLIVFIGPAGVRALSVLGVALLALWSKETAVMLPVLAVSFAFVGLDVEQRKARRATLRALFGFVVLYVAVWVSLFPEKTMGRLQATAATLRSEQSGWMALFGSVFGQLFHPVGFETWRATRDGAPTALWVGFALVLGVASLLASLMDRPRALAWRLAGLGLAFSALVVLPFRGHDAVDVYRLGHTPTIGFGILVAGFATILARESRGRAVAVALLLVLRFGPIARETSAAWGYPGFQFRMALRFNLENPIFLGGLTPEMKKDLERESWLVAHRDEPLGVLRPPP